MNPRELQQLLLMPEGLRAQYLAALKKPQKMADGGTMKGFYSPIDKLAAELPRTKGTGAEFMTELSKRPGYKPQEVQDRNLQTLMALPKMAREEFLAKLKSKPAPQLEDTTLTSKSGRSRYEEHTLPGGSNYREILMRMPHDEQRAKEFSDPASGHWDEPGVLAHVRVKDRTGPNGEKLLHIEEVQSDWHQQGRDKGYATPEALQELRAAELRHQKLKQQLDQAKSKAEYAEHSLGRKEPLFQQPDVRARFDATRIRHNNEIMDLMPQVLKAQAEVQDIGHKLNNVVPNAPFKKNWHELALKKMIHHAAEQGYHGIVITPGKEQADRYKLSKYISRVTHMTHHDDPESGILFAFDPRGNQIVEKHNVPHSELPNYIGKEGAQKLLEQKPDEHGYRELKGQNLDVGGEGMKGFYDKIVPSFLNQFGKKYGAQVGTMPIQTKTPSIEKAGTSFYQVPGKQAVLHHFPITPEMREDVTKNGVPLYADGGDVKPQPERDANLAEFLKDSAVKDRMYHATHSDFNAFRNNHRGIHFVTPKPKFANDFLTNNGQDEHEAGANIMPVHVNAKNPFDYQNKKHVNALGVKASIGKLGLDEIKKGKWGRIEDRTTLKAIKDLGHDSVYVNEGGVKNLGVFDPRMIKSAIGNRGTYDVNDPDITKAQGGSIKPVGYTKEKVTVSPNLDRMQYELMSVKHFKKAK